MKRTIRLTLAAAIVLLMGAIAYAAIVGAKKEGAVEYVGAQKEIFKTGKAASVVNLEELTGKKGVFAIGPIDGLDGEITIFDSKPYIAYSGQFRQAFRFISGTRSDLIRAPCLTGERTPG